MTAPVGSGRPVGTATTVQEFDKLTTGTASLVGFYGVTATGQPANAVQAALTLTTATTGGFGFSTASGFQDFMAQLENIRASLVLLGLLKGGA